MSKKISVKKVFAIIGIVFGVGIAFVGVVAGVLALMGKFKTPVVYPKELHFLNDGHVVVEEVPYDVRYSWDQQPKDPTIFSVDLVGKNSKAEHGVNKTKCYVWFADNVGSKLIKLCTEDGIPLVADEHNRYLVDCNKPICYMINDLASFEEPFETDGKVMLMARSINNKAQTNAPLTFWIDREIKKIVVEDATINGDNNQFVDLGVDLDFDFKFNVESDWALKPIGKESAKEIEIFYVATGLTTDYIKVTEESISQNEILSQFLSCEDGVVNFKSAQSGMYEFKIAAFPTYKEKEDYLASIESVIVPNPNYDRLQHMVYTTLMIEVEKIEISEVGLLGNEVSLELYSENDYITLDGLSGVENANNNNLKLYMKKGTAGNYVYDYSRFDEVSMEGLEFYDLAEKYPIFRTDNIPNAEDWTYTGDMENMLVATTDITIGANLSIISHLYLSDNVDAKFYCTNGVAVWDSDSLTIKLLKAGSYLNFYTEDTDGKFALLSNFDYEIKEVINSAQEKSWNIVAKEIPDLSNKTPDNPNDDLKLRIGILVINNTAETIFNQQKFFSCIGASVTEAELIYEAEESVNLNITFDNGAKYDKVVAFNAEDIDLDYIVDIKAGSYDNCVLAVKEADAANCIVDNIPNVTFTYNTQNYVLVGIIDDSNQDNYKLINNVRINSNVSSNKKECPIFMIQLFSEYGQTVSDLINHEVLSAGKQFSADEIRNVYDVTTINAKYIVDENDFTFTHDGEVIIPPINVYESSNHGFEIALKTEPEMLQNVYEFYNMGVNSVITNYPDNITVLMCTFVGEPYNNLIIGYTAEKCLRDTSEPVVLKVKFGETEITLPNIYIQSGSPENIIWNYNEGKQIELYNDIDVAKDPNANNYLKIVVSYDDSGKYVYKFFVNEEEIENLTNAFNVQISKSTDPGFQDKFDKDQELGITYGSENEEVLDALQLANIGTISNLVKKIDTTTLFVTIGTHTAYLKVITETDGGFELKTNNDKDYFEVPNNPAYLSNIIEFNHTNKNGIILNTDNLVHINNVKSIYYGDGTLVDSGDKNNGWELKKGADTILEIKSYESGWKFDKKNPYVTLTIEFDVETLAGNKTISLTFKPSIAVDVKDGWNTNRVLYAGTTVKLYDTSSSSVFSVTEAGVPVTSSDLTININGNQVAQINNYPVPKDLIGTKPTIQISYKGKVIGTFTDFEVKANVVATLKEDSYNSSTSYSVDGSVDGIDGIFNIKSYTNKTYGECYSDADLVPGCGYSLLIMPLTDDYSNLTLEWNGSELVIGAIDEFGLEKSCIIYLCDSNDGNPRIIEKYEIVIKNKYTATPKADIIDLTALTEIAIADVFTFGGALEVTIESVEIDNIVVNKTADNKSFIISTTEQPLDNVVIKFILNCDGTTVTYYTNKDHVTYNILPYRPELRPDRDQAFTGAKYDLLKGMFDVNDLVADYKVKELLVTGVLDQNEQPFATSIFENDFVESGYIRGVEGSQCEVSFKDLNVQKLDIYVVFKVVYADGKDFSFKEKLELKNRQTIQIQYPESDNTINLNAYKFIDGYTADALYLSGVTEADPSGVYVLKSTIDKVLNVENVLISSESKTTINFFKADENKKVVRASVNNVEGLDLNESSSTSKEVTIKLIAYESDGRVSSYVSSFINTVFVNEIELPQAVSGFGGTLVFKVSTASGCYDYYFIYLYSESTQLNVNSSNNLEVVVYNDGVSYPTNHKIDEEVEYGNINTYENLMTKIDFKSVYGVDYTESLIKIYLYEIKSLGVEYNYEDDRWTDVSNSEIYRDKKFNTITIGICYENVQKRYSLGTMTIYVQPEEAVTESDLDYNAPNGEFTKTIEPNEGQFDNRLVDLTTVEIVDVKNEEYKLHMGSIVKASLETTDGVDANFNDKIIYIDGSTIKLKKKVDVDLVFVVKYSNGSTVAYVTYTYKATSIPDMSDVGNTFMDVGKFKESSFESEINLADETNKEFFFGKYSGDYTLKVTQGEGACDIYTKDLLKFTLGTSQQIVKIKFTYDDLAYDDNWREFTFIVNPGIHVDNYTNLADSESGLAATKRKKTEIAGADMYKGKIGSKLDVEYNAIAGIKKYTIGDNLFIYTCLDTKLSFSFADAETTEDVINYVVGGANIAECNQGTILEFAHLPSLDGKGKNVNVKIDVQDSAGVVFKQTDFYIEIIPTYSMLQANYLVDGAYHENVASYIMDGENKKESKIVDLHKEMLGSGRFILLGTTITNGKYNPITDDDDDLTLMGFADTNNPNYIDFSVGANATISGAENKTITFREVSSITQVILNLNNDAGMAEVYYTFQIMPGELADGVNYGSTNGYYDYDGNYVSFLMNDTDSAKDYSNADKEALDKDRPFVIGKLLDDNNDWIIDELQIQNGTVSVVEVQIKEGLPVNNVGNYYNATQYQFGRGNYTCYLTFDWVNRTIELILKRSSGNDTQPEVSFTINAGGVNGGISMINGLTIYISNLQVYSNYEDKTDTTVYAGDFIDLVANKKITQPEEAELTYEMTDSAYSFGGQEYNLTRNQTDNDLFKYEDGVLQVYAVGASDVRASVNFIVKKGSYVIKEVTYNFDVNLNMQFVVNGGLLSENEGNSSPETYFVLTQAGPSAEYSFASKSVMDTDNKKSVDGVDYFDILVFDLYRLHIQGNDTASQADKLMSKNVVNVELDSALPSGIVTVSNNSITFTKDYTGDIDLRLSVTTDNGIYSVVWTIHVSGIRTHEYAVANHEFARLQSSGMPFNSGAEVNIVAGSTGSGEVAGIKQSMPKEHKIDSVDITYYYLYAINVATTENMALTNRQLFDRVADVAKLNDDETLEKPTTSNILPINLPTVPSTDDLAQQSYFVTYKIWASYKGFTTDEFYVTYQVINRQKVKTYTVTNPETKPSSVIDVDKNLIDDKNLVLFQYQDIYTAGTNVYKLYYDAQTLAHGTVVIEHNGAIITKHTTKDGENIYLFDNGYKFDAAEKVLYDSTGAKITGGSWSNKTTYSNDSSTVYSVFQSDFNNAFEFYNFIVDYVGVVGGICIGDKQFTLIPLDVDGLFGIDLSAQFNGENKFDNECVEALKLKKGDVEVITIDAYNEETESGFKLTTSNKILAKTNNGLGYTISSIVSPNYFDDKDTSDTLTINSKIIGVGTPGNNWVNKGTADYVTYTNDVYATITIPDGDTGHEYKIKKVTYDSTSESGLYNLTADFYYIDLNSNALFVTPDYNAVGIETTYFKIPYVEVDGKVTLDLTKAFKVWKMDTTLPAEDNKGMIISNEEITFETDSLDSDLNRDGNTIYILAQTLKDEKKVDPTKKNYDKFTLNITVEDMQIECELQFSLPTYVTLDANQGEDLSIIGMRVPDVSGNYVELTADKLNIVQAIEETSEGRFISVYNALNGKISFNNENINKYFEYNAAASRLVITCRLITTDAKILEFQIVVNKGAAEPAE